MLVRFSAACSMRFLSCSALPTPMLTTIFCSLGKLNTFARPNFSFSLGIISLLYFSCNRAISRPLAMDRTFRQYRFATVLLHLVRISGAWLAQRAQADATLLAEALLAAVVAVALADANAALTVAAVELHVG